MQTFQIVFQSIVMWLIFHLVGMNFCGFIVRGIIFRSPDPSLSDEDDKLKEIVRWEMAKQALAGTVVSIIFIVGAFFYLRAVYRHWNIWMMLAGFIPMITRIPDLLWEIRLGKRPNVKEMRPWDALNVCMFVIAQANMALIAAALSIHAGIGVSWKVLLCTLAVWILKTAGWTLLINKLVRR
jgi:hypothetical protein